MTVQYSRRLGAEPAVKAKLPSLLGSRWAVAAFVVLSVALVSLTARDGLANLYGRWWYEEEYGYGFLAAALVPFFLWTRRHVVQALSTDTKWPGLVLVTVAQLSGVLGALGESYFIEQIAFVFTLLGLAVVVFGTGPIRIFVPLTLILLLTIPLPYTLQAMVTVKLQLISTEIGVAAIRLVGIPVFVEGNIIDLGQYKVQVAEACSGLRYLLPLTCISLILAYLYRAPLWKKAVIVASAPVIAVLINSFRIAVIAVLVDNYGSHMAEGFLHQFEGWVVFLVGAVLLGVEILVLERFRLANLNMESLFDGPMASLRVGKSISLNGSAIAALCGCALALAAATSIASAYEYAPKPVRQDFANFPRQIGNWSGREGQLEPAILDALKATDTYTGDFSEASTRVPVNLFVAYYDSLSKGAAIHSPRVCLPGSGWEFASFEERDFGELAPGVSGTFNRVVIQKGEQKILMYYWFHQRERRTANEFSMKYYLLVDSFKKSRKDGALVRIYTTIAAGESNTAEADRRLRAFAESALPRMNEYLPQ
jgi:exosortase D (VPLPA-CTERM-specific)